MYLCTSGTLVSAQNWAALALGTRVEVSSLELSQQLLATDIPVTGKARKFLVPVSGHVGQASISLLSEVGQEALYVFIRSESDHFGNLRYTLPVHMADGDEMSSAILGPNDEAVIDLPMNAEIKLTIRAKEIKYQGVDVKELQSELEIRHTLADGTVVTQQLKIVPNRLFEIDGHKCKDMIVEFERKERTRKGKRSRSIVRFELRELRSEDFEGRLGGPPVFVSKAS